MQDKQAAAVFNVQSNKYLKPIAVMDIPYRMQQEKLAAGHPQDAFLQLGLVYILHRSNSRAQEFELERAGMIPAGFPSRAQGLQ